MKLVQKLMRHLGLRSIVVKKWRYEHNNYIDQMTYPNLLKQDFKAVKPNQKWAADITYIPTKTDGWCYLAIIMDLYSRKIIAHKLSRHMTTELVVNVLNQACETRTVKAGLILHTDLGSQYRSTALETALKQHAIGTLTVNVAIRMTILWWSHFMPASRRRRFTNGLTKTIMKPIWLNLVTLKDFIILGGSLVPMAI
ncbi:hypothetical protein EFN62_08300 [Pediococcus parvulus]|nr:hypothetical protein [Pediococcus parvulus]